MIWVALKMLTGNRGKFYAIIFGIAFACMLALWVSGWRGSPFVWRGNAVSSVAASESPQA